VDVFCVVFSLQKIGLNVAKSDLIALVMIIATFVAKALNKLKQQEELLWQHASIPIRLKT